MRKPGQGWRESCMAQMGAPRARVMMPTQGDCVLWPRGGGAGRKVVQEPHPVPDTEHGARPGRGTCCPFPERPSAGRQLTLPLTRPGCPAHATLRDSARPAPSQLRNRKGPGPPRWLEGHCLPPASCAQSHRFTRMPCPAMHSRQLVGRESLLRGDERHSETDAQRWDMEGAAPPSGMREAASGIAGSHMQTG